MSEPTRQNVKLRVTPESWARFMVLCDEQNMNPHEVVGSIIKKLNRFMSASGELKSLDVLTPRNVSQLRRTGTG